jgi:chromosome partitioning protein
MASAEISMTNLIAREQILNKLLCMVKDKYDYILIDCPPSLGIVTTNAFLAADEIFVPMTPELLPLKGMRMLDNFIATLQQVKPSVCLNGVFTTRFNNRRLNKVVENAVRSRYKDIMLNTRIRENITLAESAGSGKSIFEYDANSNGAKDYKALTEEIMNR